MQFKRVLKNLVNNSIIYGKPDTNIELKAKQKDNHSYIYVKDYGKGVAKEDIDKMTLLSLPRGSENLFIDYEIFDIIY